MIFPVQRAIASLFTLLILGTAIPVKAADAITDLMENGSDQYRQGDFAGAIDTWKLAEIMAVERHNPDARVNALLSQATVLRMLGRYDQALAVLREAAVIAGQIQDMEQTARVYARLGDLHLALGQDKTAMSFLEDAEDAAVAARSPEALALVLINTGIAHATRKDFADAAAAWNECLFLLDKLDQALPALKSRVFINQSRMNIRIGDSETMTASIRDALNVIADRNDGYAKARDLVSLALLAMEARQTLPGAADELDPLALNALQQAQAIAGDLESPKLMSLVKGHKGRLYELRGRKNEALRLTLSALFDAQQSGTSPEIRYLWHWQAGRLHKAAGDDDAIRSYRLAVEALDPIRQELVTGYLDRHDFFQKKIRPVYLELARLLLEKARNQPDKAQRESLLRQGRDVMERLKTVELQEYFQDPCVADLETGSIEPEAVGTTTAVLYPIPFPDYLAILLITNNGIKLYVSKVSSIKLDRTVRRFRRLLQNSRGSGFQEDGLMLYNWLVSPIEQVLNQGGVDTLIVAPDGVLRLIPFAALWDGSQFLVERFAVGTVPAMTLTVHKYPKDATGPTSPASGRALLEGLSQARQGFASLPSVRQEIKTLQEMMGGAVLLDEDFTLENLTRAFETADYDIVHIATHGVFEGGSENTFLLTHDEKLTMDRLEDIIDRTRRRGNQVDLMTLSACQTALGDEWAAFGLAGIAVKAGVGSAVASLWFADDEASFEIMTAFYRHFHQEKQPKARALQLAQQKMIQDERFYHPAFWAPFLLIGSWL